MSNITPSQILLILWTAWALFLFGGGLLGKPDAERTRRMPRWTRMVSSIILVVAAWSFVLIHYKHTYVDSIILIAIGMTFGFIGDMFMAQLILHDNRHVMGGIGAFGLGHVAYIAAFLRLLSDRQLTLDWNLRYAANTLNNTLSKPIVNGTLLASCWLIAAMIWYWVIYRTAKERSPLHFAALPYALLLATTVGAAWNVTLYEWDIYKVSINVQTNLMSLAPLDKLGIEGNITLRKVLQTSLPALGTLLFFISDFILAARLFNKAYFKLIDDWIWLTYGPGQMFIVYGVGLLFLS